MTAPAAFTGSYADIKLIRSRSVMQIIVEVPIEQAEAVIAAFGVPQPGHERPVAVALLNSGPSQEAASRVASYTPAPETFAGKDDGQPAITTHGVAGHEPMRQGAAFAARPARAESKSDTTVSDNPQADAQAPFSAADAIAAPIITMLNRDAAGQPAAAQLPLERRIRALCQEKPFCDWLGDTYGYIIGNHEDAENVIRELCNVDSMVQFRVDSAARSKADSVALGWDQECGRAAMDWRSA